MTKILTTKKFKGVGR